MKKLILIYFIIFISSQLIMGQSANFEWAKGVGGANSEIADAMVTDVYGNVYTTGIFNGTMDFDPGPGVFNLSGVAYNDIFILKLDRHGNFVWAKQIAGPSIDGGYGITIDKLGNVYSTGGFTGNTDFDPGTGTYFLDAGLGYNVYISKLDSAGTFVWAKQFGGTLHDEGRDIKLDNAGNIYTTGYFHSTADFDPGAGTFNLTSSGVEDIFISKLDSSGNFLWAAKMGSTMQDYGHGIEVDGLGNVYTTGFFNLTVDFDPGVGTFNLTSSGDKDIFVSKLDAFGKFSWAVRIGDTLSDVGSNPVIDAAGNIYITGYFGGTVDFDPGNAVSKLTSLGGNDIFILKLNHSGNFIWAKSIGGTGTDLGRCMVNDPFGNIYIAGQFMLTVDFDPGPATLNYTSLGGFDICLFKLDSSGNLIWAYHSGGIMTDVSIAITLDNSWNVLTSGLFNGVVDFDPGIGTTNLTSSGGSDIYIQKMSQPNVGINKAIKNFNFDIYPNPTSGLFKIIIPEEQVEETIEIYNSLGVLVHQQQILNTSDKVNIVGLPKGIYFLKLMGPNKISGLHKIIKL